MYLKYILPCYCLLLCFSCGNWSDPVVMTTAGSRTVDRSATWLSHEHILVDFIGADSIRPQSWDQEAIIDQVLPYLKELEQYNLTYFVDATPQGLGREPELLQKISDRTGLQIITNTGFYGARNNKYVPSDFKDASPEQMAELWIDEFRNGIGNSKVRPGFIKISVDNIEPLDSLHQKIVYAAGLTHLRTGLTIASHTGKSTALWPQLDILVDLGVPANKFIWVHAQNEEDLENYVKAADKGCWISLDGIGWGWEAYLDKLLFAKQNDILDHILVSHDAGWYDPQKTVQEIQPYTALFKYLMPALKAEGFTESEIQLMLSENPARAYSYNK